MGTCYNNYEANIASFVKEEISPFANTLDKEQSIPKELIKKIADKGLFGASIKKRYGGLELKAVELCSMHVALAKGHSSIENMLTVNSMVAVPIQRFGTQEQKDTWLPALARGEKIAAIALTEPVCGSSLRDVQVEISEKPDYYLINGIKRWITLGQIADLFLVLCKIEGLTCAVLIDRNTPGLIIEPIFNMLGLRANLLAQITFDNCKVPKSNLVGKPVDGISTAIVFGLDEGRFTTACGSLGIASFALELATKHITDRIERLGEYQLVQKLLTEMIVDVESAKSFCFQAALARDERDPLMIKKTLLAKYVASKAATNSTCKAIQIMGATGCHQDSGIERLYRDAKIMEIIEGTTQIHEVQIAKQYLQSKI